VKKWIKTGFKQIIAVVKTDSTSLCTEGVESVLTTQRNGFGFNNNSCKKLNNQARSGTKCILVGAPSTREFTAPQGP